MRNNYFQILFPQFPFNAKRIFLKSLFLIGIGHGLMAYFHWSVNLNTPEWMQRAPMKHPITPPFVVPHKWEEPEQLYDRYQQHWRRIMDIVQFERLKYNMIGGDHPKLETEHIISDSYWTQENERVIEEAKNELKQKMRGLKLKELPNLQHNISKVQLINKLQSKVKPLL